MTSELRAYTFIGAGAIGGTVAHAMAKVGYPVTLVDTDADHIASIREKGLRIRAVDGTDDVVHVAAYTPDDYPEDLPIVCAVIATKAQHTRTAAQWASGRLTADGFAVSLQNGFNESVIADEVGVDRVVGVFVNIFADYLEPGVISFGGTGALAVGEPAGGAPSANALMVAMDFRAYGPVTATANLPGYRWAKRGFGGVLGVASVADIDMARVVEQYPDLVVAMARESTEVARRAGLVLESFDHYEPYAFGDNAPEEVKAAALARLVRYLDGQPKNRSGGFRDIAVRKRPGERPLVDDGFGALAEAHGVDLYFSRAVFRIIGEISRGEREFSLDNFDELRAEVAANA